MEDDYTVTGSGNGVTVATVTAEGVDIETLDETTHAVAQ